MPPGEKFVPIDVRLDNSENQILIITGPNMSGKSVFFEAGWFDSLVSSN